jgi:sialidase-1
MILHCSGIRASDARIEQQDVFVSGTEGYHTYRIPAVLVTKKGTILAFCEGRVKGRGDAGDIDLVLRRSSDGGKTWSSLVNVWNDGENTCGNPCPVVDQETGTIWLPMTWNAGKISERKIKPGFGKDSRRVFVTHSTDDGLTWSEPREITAETKKKEWSWYATGPGAGIQIQNGPHRGRLVIPCDHKVPATGDNGFWSHVIYSDDHGATWQLGGVTPRDRVNECEVVELDKGRLLLNMRNYDKRVPARQICVSDDGGKTWKNQKHDPALIEPTCQASLRRYRWPERDQHGILLFSNPADPKLRERMTIRASYDDGESWPVARLLHEGSAAYSCLVVLPDGQIGCLYERDNYAKISLATFSLDWLKESP